MNFSLVSGKDDTPKGWRDKNPGKPEKFLKYSLVCVSDQAYLT